MLFRLDLFLDPIRLMPVPRAQVPGFPHPLVFLVLPEEALMAAPAESNLVFVQALMEPVGPLLLPDLLVLEESKLALLHLH
ncbi:hypothetical protein HYW39_01340 [Candidatus Curtissbacteria bacterium]|nr:hypothetical protein [Candidatus Curtissbacteria bacterium]